MISGTGDTRLLILQKEYGLLVILHFRYLWGFYVFLDEFCFSEKQKLPFKELDLGRIWGSSKIILSLISC